MIRKMLFAVTLLTAIAAARFAPSVEGDPSQWVAGDPSQWGVDADGDPSQWLAGDPSQWGVNADGDPSQWG